MSVDVKISGLPEDTAPTTDDYTVTIDTGSGATKKVKLQNLMSLAAQYVLPTAFPVGSYYINGTDGTNPNILLGFGTWVAVTGKTIVGKSSTGTFTTAGATGGEENHTLSWDEMPVHNHSGSTDGQGAHNHTIGTLGSSGSYGIKDGAASSSGTGFTSSAGNHAHNFTTSNAGSGLAHNNMPPYVVAYVWQRTA